MNFLGPGMAFKRPWGFPEAATEFVDRVMGKVRPISDPEDAELDAEKRPLAVCIRLRKHRVRIKDAAFPVPGIEAIGVFDTPCVNRGQSSEPREAMSIRYTAQDICIASHLRKTPFGVKSNTHDCSQAESTLRAKILD